MLMAQNVIAQPLWARGIRQTALENGLHQWVTAGHDIAYHKQIRVQIELFDTKALDELNPLFLQLGTHGWIDTCITARNLMSRRSCEQCQPTHKSSTNPQNMNMHLLSQPVKLTARMQLDNKARKLKCKWADQH